jgi:hypothetical protein
MNADLYTKAVLTVIAACLIWICVNGMTPSAQAQTAPTPGQPVRVMIVDEKGNPLHTTQGFRVNLGPQPLPIFVSNTSLPVTVGNSSLAVAVRSIQRAGAWDPLQVQVLRDPPTLMPTP